MGMSIDFHKNINIVLEQDGKYIQPNSIVGTNNWLAPHMTILNIMQQYILNIQFQK